MQLEVKYFLWNYTCFKIKWNCFSLQWKCLQHKLSFQLIARSLGNYGAGNKMRITVKNGNILKCLCYNDE